MTNTYKSLVFVVVLAIGGLLGFTSNFTTKNQVIAAPYQELPLPKLQNLPEPKEFNLHIDLENGHAQLEGNANVNANISVNHKIDTVGVPVAVPVVVYKPVMIKEVKDETKVITLKHFPLLNAKLEPLDVKPNILSNYEHKNSSHEH